MPAAASTEINTLFKFDSTARSPFCGRSHCALVGLRHLFFPTPLGLSGAGSLRIYSYSHTPNGSSRTCGGPSWDFVISWLGEAGSLRIYSCSHTPNGSRRRSRRRHPMFDPRYAISGLKVVI